MLLSKRLVKGVCYFFLNIERYYYEYKRAHNNIFIIDMSKCIIYVYIGV